MPLLEAKMYRSAEARQRFDLARAIYSPKHILLLDDVLSGLDRKTEQVYFTASLARQTYVVPMGLLWYWLLIQKSTYASQIT